jgi:hypothetical protein
LKYNWASAKVGTARPVLTICHQELTLANSPIFSSPVGSFWLPAVTPEGLPMDLDDPMASSNSPHLEDFEPPPSTSTLTDWSKFQNLAQSPSSFKDIPLLPELELDLADTFPKPSEYSDSSPREFSLRLLITPLPIRVICRSCLKTS